MSPSWAVIKSAPGTKVPTTMLAGTNPKHGRVIGLVQSIKGKTVVSLVVKIWGICYSGYEFLSGSRFWGLLQSKTLGSAMTNTAGYLEVMFSGWVCWLRGPKRSSVVEAPGLSAKKATGNHGYPPHGRYCVVGPTLHFVHSYWQTSQLCQSP